MYTKILNSVTTVLLIRLSYTIGRYVPGYHAMFDIRIDIHFLDRFAVVRDFGTIFFWGAVVYSVMCIVSYIFGVGYSKSYHVFQRAYKLLRAIFTRHKPHITKEEKLAVLTVAVKMFFVPLMFVRTFTNGQFLINTISNVIQYRQENIQINWYDYYSRHLHRLFLNIILFVDVAFFFVGYTIEAKGLKNTIKSVEPTLLGRLVTIVCYPLLNAYTSKILGRYSSNYPNFEQYFGESSRRNHASVRCGIVIIVCMTIYMLATVALGRKASNMTNRGIVSHGVYRFVRHPAYIAKNIARIVGALPLIVHNISQGRRNHAFLIMLSLFFWCSIYHMRARTEERHLSQDPDYIAYKQKVKRMYIPKIW